jgi:hypothetical protein
MLRFHFRTFEALPEDRSSFSWQEQLPKTRQDLVQSTIRQEG